MKIKYSVVVALLALTFVFSSQALARAADIELSWNDRLVMHALRTVHSAETSYQMTSGSGNYGTLQSLQQQELVDAGLASGDKYGYRFTLLIRPASASQLESFELTATPLVRRARFLSFYINEACEIRGDDKFGRNATVADPVIEPCGASPRTENERLSISSLRTIHGGQMTYQATSGNGNYGTFGQLYDAFLIRTGFVLASSYRGYTAEMTVTHATATSPARFNVRIVPQQYGRTGIRSFYIDESGVLRGADKQGAPANETDPPIDN